MVHDTELIGTLTVGLVAAFVGGFIAQRLRLSPIVGYLLAGVAVGPFTPGVEADVEIARQVAEIGVILLMFGVGIHFSLRELWSVRAVAIPGAALQIAALTAAATLIAMAWGWSFGEGLVLGLAISIASTVVLLRALEDRHALASPEGKIAIGWLIVEDLFTVLVLVLLPALAEPLGGVVPEDFGGTTSDNVALALVIALGKLAVLIALMFFVAARAVPWLLMQVSRTGSRELFTLAVLAGALGIAYASAEFFDVSLALGAFLAGLVVGQSALSHQAAADALPLRDSFAVLFFVSVGMLFDPEILFEEPARLAAIVGLILLGNSLVSSGAVLIFGYPVRTALVVGAGVAQIGEFSFIIADLALDFQLLSADGYNLILGAALISISLNPLLFAGIGPIERWFAQQSRFQARSPARELSSREPMHGRHAVVVGYGDVGRAVVSVLRESFDVFIIERNLRVAEEIEGVAMVVVGDAVHPLILEQAALDTCVVLIATIPDPYATRLIVERARAIRPNLDVIARALDEEEAALLREAGAAETVLPEREAALEMIRHALQRFGIEQRRALAIVQRLRRGGWSGSLERGE
jgi:CPA2 family monovalent cation:H+ antiporter-2